MSLFLILTLVVPMPPVAEPTPDAKQLAVWVADLDSEDTMRRKTAYDGLVKAGPKAKAVVPDLIKIVADKSVRGSARWVSAVEVLGAIGADARDAVPALTALLNSRSANNWEEAIAATLVKIEGPKPGTTRALLLATKKGGTIVLNGSEYHRANRDAVAGHLLAFCADKERDVRQKSVIVLAGLEPLTNPSRDVLIEVGEVVKEVNKKLPAVFEKLLADEDALVRMTTAHGLSRIAPDRAAKVIPVVVATMTEPKLKDQVSGVPSAEIFQPIPAEAAKALIPLFDGPDHGRWWAIDTLSKLPVRAQLEPVIKNGKTTRAREAAVMALSAYVDENRGATVALLTSALKDREFTVRFAAADKLAFFSPPDQTAPPVVPVLVEGLKQNDAAVRSRAAGLLRFLGEFSRPAVPALKQALGDRDPEVAIEVALALTEVAPADAADAVPVLALRVKGASKASGYARATEAARALAALGPVAKDAVPVLVAQFDAELPQLRFAVAEAAARIDPAQGEKAAGVLVAALKQADIPPDAIRGLARIGPPAKAALPALRELHDSRQKFLRPGSFQQLEVAFALLSVDPGTDEHVAAWLRRVVAEYDGTPVKVDVQYRELGPRAKPILAELIAMLGAKDARTLECAALTLGAIGPFAKGALPRLKELAEKDAGSNLGKIASQAVTKIEGNK